LQGQQEGVADVAEAANGVQLDVGGGARAAEALAGAGGELGRLEQAAGGLALPDLAEAAAAERFAEAEARPRLPRPPGGGGRGRGGGGKAGGGGDGRGLGGGGGGVAWAPCPGAVPPRRGRSPSLSSSIGRDPAGVKSRRGRRGRRLVGGH